MMNRFLFFNFFMEIVFRHFQNSFLFTLTLEILDMSKFFGRIQLADTSGTLVCLC